MNKQKLLHRYRSLQKSYKQLQISKKKIVKKYKKARIFRNPENVTIHVKRVDCVSVEGDDSIVNFAPGNYADITQR